MQQVQWLSGRRAMAIWLPRWSIDLLGRRERSSHKPDARATLLVMSTNRQQVVARLCERAEAAGVQAGMPIAQARALFDVHYVRIEPYDPQRDRAALRSLAVWAQRFSPTVAVDDPDGLLLDVTGCERVFRGERRLVRTVARDLDRLGFRSRIAIAPTIGCAWAMSRLGPDDSSIVEPTAACEAIASLSVSALRLDDDTITKLAEIGIKRIGDVLELPRSTLPARFGDELLLRLDQALGQAIETIEPVRPVLPPTAERVFDGPTDRVGVIELTVRGLLDELSRELQQREAGARSIEVELVRSDLPPERLSITLGPPGRDARHLWTLLRPKLERAHLGFGVEAVRLRAGSVARIRHEQIGCASSTRGPSVREAAQMRDGLIDTLRNRLGMSRVLRAEVVESYLPERSVAMRSIPDHRPIAGVCVTPQDRPTVLLDRPFPADAMALTPDGPIHRVRWRGVSHEIVTCLGPERISSEWWQMAESTRDYFTVQTRAGRWLWLGRSLETGKWYIHGVWA